MAAVTVKTLAERLKVPTDRLLAQFEKAGNPMSNEDQAVSQEQQRVLLEYLRQAHGTTKKTISKTVGKVTLKRRTKEELQADSKSKSVSVEVRKKRVYVKRDVVEEEKLAAQAAAAAEKLADEAIESPVEIPATEAAGKKAKA
ncbi:MAG: translation initiation factor IF-2 associated domain-containing protein, partial [Gammaproteobacteria bacterium]